MIPLLAACEAKVDPSSTLADSVPPATEDCSATEFDGVVYDCRELDRCDLGEISFRLACCDCDPAYCAPDNCGDDDDVRPPAQPSSSCMGCHNGSMEEDYAGIGLPDPHPFGSTISCDGCHGGDPAGLGADDSHVPPPPSLADPTAGEAWFGRLTLAGVDLLPDYVVDGVTYRAIDWLRFENPGDDRVVSAGAGCGAGGCHPGHASAASPMSNAAGIASESLFVAGVGAGSGAWSGTAADWGMAPASDPGWTVDAGLGAVAGVAALPERAAWGASALEPVVASALPADRYPPDHPLANAVIPGTPLHDVVSETVALGCGGCHGANRGQNARAGSFRSSGCSSCHLAYGLDGRTAEPDPNLDPLEPAAPDALSLGERPHPLRHRIAYVARTDADGTEVPGVGDAACLGCHQGSNWTVLQYWGIRPDPSRDVAAGFQYPANPLTFADASGDPRLFGANATFAGKTPDQLLVEEDYDGDGRDDTPPDVHHEAGLGCVDCHASTDVHGDGRVWSRMSQVVSIGCESCHGTLDAPASAAPCTDLAGVAATCATDRRGDPLRNVTLDGAGRWWLQSRLDGASHPVRQVRDIATPTGALDPIDGQPSYDPYASYAMGRADGDDLNGVGPLQSDPNATAIGFSHTDRLACDACHASWENSCVGCHLQLVYDAAGPISSTVGGGRVTARITNADTTFALPNWFVLTVTPRGELGAATPGIKPFLRYVDAAGGSVSGLAFSDANGLGNHPGIGGSGPDPALAHDRIAPHTIRGAATATAVGTRSCAVCHLNDDQLSTWDAAGEYRAYVAAIDAGDYQSLDFGLLRVHLGSNPDNALNSPYVVHRTAGLGTGLLLADAQGCPVTPLDANPNRAYCPSGPPAFDPAAVAFDWDRVTERAGVTGAALARPLLDPTAATLRGSNGEGLAGPLSAALLTRLADPELGLVLDAWVDAAGVPHGRAAEWIR